MKRSSMLVWSEVVLLLAAGAGSVVLPRAGFTASDLFWFVAGLGVLKLSDVGLPRGDAIGMSSALALGALLLFDVRFVLVVLIVAELLALLPSGRNGKWLSAIGALAAESTATVVCSGLLLALGLSPEAGMLTHVGRALRPMEYASVLSVGVLFAVLEYCVLQAEMAIRDRRPLIASILGSISYGGWLIAAQASAGVLVALMYRTMNAWGLIVSVVIILVMRQSFVLLLDIRQAYDATIAVLVRATEAQQPGREGVSSRSAEVAVRVGRALGMHGRDLEHIRYAALLLGLGGDESADGLDAAADSSKIIEEIGFLKDVAPILRICSTPREAGKARRSDLTCAYVVTAVASATGVVPEPKAGVLRDRISPRIVREIDATVAAIMSQDLCLEESRAPVGLL